MSEFGFIALVVFLASVLAGVVMHEGAHGAVLRYYGYEHEYSVGLGEGDRLV